jgi:DNA-binding NarL/FixJ family response regulator
MICPTIVLIVDDQLLMRNALALWLRSLPGIQVSGVTASIDEVVSETRRLRPNVVIINVDMPGQTPFEAARFIRTNFPDTRVIFLAAFLNDQGIQQALTAGASACISRHEPPENLVRALCGRESPARNDGQDLCPLPADSPPPSPAANPQSRSSTLTPREQEVLRHLAAGLTKKEIARLLYISVNTVNRHTDNIMAKLGIHDRVRLTHYAIREGLADPVAP